VGNDDKFRLVNNKCERCNKLSQAMGSVTISRQILVWCPSCIKAARSEKIPGVTVNTYRCERCNHRVELTTAVLWPGHNEQWCQVCISEVV